MFAFAASGFLGFTAWVCVGMVFIQSRGARAVTVLFLWIALPGPFLIQSAAALVAAFILFRSPLAATFVTPQVQPTPIPEMPLPTTEPA